MVRSVHVLLLASLPLFTAQDLEAPNPLLCSRIPSSQRPAPLHVTVSQIQTTVREPPQLARDSCPHDLMTSGSAGHTFPSALAGHYVTISNVVVTATEMNKQSAANWVAVQMLSGEANVGLEVYTEIYADALSVGALVTLTGYVRDIGEEDFVAVPAGEDWYVSPDEVQRAVHGVNPGNCAPSIPRTAA